MNQSKPHTYKQNKKVIRDWTDKKHYLVHYRMLKIYVRHGLVIDEIHEIFSFKHSERL